MKKNDHELIQKIIEGGVSRPVFDAFQNRLRMEPELAALYQDYSLLHHSLCEEFESMPVARNIVSMPVSRRSNVSAIIASIGAVAAVLLVSWIMLNRPAMEAAPSFARIRFSDHARWEIQGSHHPVQGSISLVEGGTLLLHEGLAKLELNSSATAVLEGPATLVFRSDESLHLQEGSGRFKLTVPDRKLTVTTPSLTAIDLGTEFGVVAHPDKPDELHVIEGKVKLVPTGKADGPILSKGHAGRVGGSGEIERFPTQEERFQSGLISYELVHLEPFGSNSWDVRSGDAAIGPSGIMGGDFQAFRALPSIMPSREKPILLATMTVESPEIGEFHTDGWAGMSFMREDREVMFFGDSHGGEKTWSIDIKQDAPVVLPVNHREGPATMTLKYDFSNGVVSLHEGGLPLGPSICSASIPIGSSFDEIRIGAAPGAAISVSRLEFRLGAPR
jgi:hypothetical protein